MLRWIVPLSLAALPVVAEAAAPLPSDAWWEKVTIRMTGSGEAQGCQYQTNRPASAGADCQVVGASGAAAAASSTKDGVTSITFERRFSPGSAPPSDAAIQQGEKMLGRKVMALAINQAGKVSGCKVVDSSGDTGLAYGCEEASGEQFASAASASADRRGFMTILVYGHNEHVV